MNAPETRFDPASLKLRPHERVFVGLVNGARDDTPVRKVVGAWREYINHAGVDHGPGNRVALLDGEAQHAALVRARVAYRDYAATVNADEFEPPEPVVVEGVPVRGFAPDLWIYHAPGQHWRTRAGWEEFYDIPAGLDDETFAQAVESAEALMNREEAFRTEHAALAADRRARSEALRIAAGGEPEEPSASEPDPDHDYAQERRDRAEAYRVAAGGEPKAPESDRERMRAELHAEACARREKAPSDDRQ